MYLLHVRFDSVRLLSALDLLWQFYIWTDFDPCSRRRVNCLNSEIIVIWMQRHTVSSGCRLLVRVQLCTVHLDSGQCRGSQPKWYVALLTLWKDLGGWKHWGAQVGIRGSCLAFHLCGSRFKSQADTWIGLQNADYIFGILNKMQITFCCNLMYFFSWE